MKEMKTALVLGAGGFIGSWMVKRLKSEGYWVRGVDINTLSSPDMRLMNLLSEILEIKVLSTVQLNIKDNWVTFSTVFPTK